MLRGKPGRTVTVRRRRGSSAGAESRPPSYPREAAEREAAAGPERSAHDLAGRSRRVGAYLIFSLLLLAPLAVVAALGLASSPGDDSGTWGVVGLAYIVFVLGLVILPVLLDYLRPLWDERDQARA
jgi:hypothetical protein